MKPSKILSLVCAAALVAGSSHAQFSHVYTGNTNLAIPQSGTGGAAGGTSNAANATSFSLTVPTAFGVAAMTVGLDVSHTSVGDLRIELSHCGTTVVLYNQSPVSTANLNGVYTFDDVAASTFASAINAAGPNGVVVPGSYAPVGPLSAFNGKSAAGDWTVTVFDLIGNNTGALSGMSMFLNGGTEYTSSASPMNIPDGLNGQCLSPVTQVVNVWSHGAVGDVNVELAFTHSYVSDLDITLQHDGVSVTLSQWAAPASNANVSGPIYSFWDGASTAWTAAESTYVNGTIPGGFYRPKQPLSAFAGQDQIGSWYLTICDRSANDVGSLGFVGLVISRSAYNLALTQPNGPASITLTNSGGQPGHAFVNLFTLAQGTSPAGWVAGLDISVSDLLAEVTFGAPFTGVLGPCGTTAVTLPGAIPSGLTLWGVSLELDASGSPVATKPVFTYTTL